MEIEYFEGGVDAKNKVQELRDNLYEFTLKERQRYQVAYDVVIQYAKNNNVFISDVNEITGIKTSSKLEDFKYVIYCTRPLEHANKIINLIYEKLKNEPLISTLSMSTVVQNEEFLIYYDTRILVQVCELYKDTSKQSCKCIIAKKINGVPYLPAELEIIDIYHSMYTASSPLDNMINFEEKLSNEIIQVTGGEIGDVKQTCYERKKDELEAIKIAIIKDLFKGKDNIAILGPMAVDWLTEKEKICPKYDRLQVVSKLTPEELKDLLEKYMLVLGKNYKISISEGKDLLIPKDFRTNRIIFSVSIQTDLGIKEKPFLEYFTSCQFELVPVFEADGVLVASKYVLSRFLFIDLWIGKFIYSLGRLDKNSYVERQARLLDLIKKCTQLDFVVDGVLGQYYDYNVNKKEMMRGEERRFFPYYPASYMEKNKKLRHI